MDCAAMMVICLQETKIPALAVPTGYKALHSVRQAWQGGVIATLVPQALTIVSSTITDFYVHVQVAVDRNTVHILNCYMPLSCHCMDSEAWATILTHLDSLSTTEPVVLVGNLNAHLGGL